MLESKQKKLSASAVLVQLLENSQPPLVRTSQSVSYLEKRLRAEHAKKNRLLFFGTCGWQSVHLRLPGGEASAGPAPAGPDRSNEAYLLPCLWLAVPVIHPSAHIAVRRFLSVQNACSEASPTAPTRREVQTVQITLRSAAAAHFDARRGDWGHFWRSLNAAASCIRNPVAHPLQASQPIDSTHPPPAHILSAPRWPRTNSDWRRFPQSARDREV